MTKQQLFTQLCDAVNALEHVAQCASDDAMREALAAIILRLDEIIDDVAAPRMGRHPRRSIRRPAGYGSSSTSEDC